jgi:FkbM family methyltransferase
MKQFQNIWMPDTEVELIEWMKTSGQIVDGKGTYQYPKLQAAMSLCMQFRTAIDQGSHVGLWTMHLAKWFNFVVCVEPLAHLRECWHANMADNPHLSKCSLEAFALGKGFGRVRMMTNPAAGGDSWIETPDATKRVIYGHTAEPVGDMIDMVTIDALELNEVDFIKLDAEGYEENIARGAEETIALSRPVIVIEQKHAMARKFGLEPRGGVTYLHERHNYRVAKEMSGDFIMVPM